MFITGVLAADIISASNRIGSPPINTV